MFRRFTIVCWVLFAISASIAAAGGIGYQHYDGLKNEVLDAASDRGWNRFEIFDPVYPKPGDVVPGEAPWDKYQFVEQYQKAKYRSESFIALALVSGSFALLLLVWNVILHTGHWVWMGRVNK